MVEQKERLESRLVDEAWIGDAVLTLYSRLRILREEGRLNAEKCIRMTSNQFLSSLGEPSQVEAELGRVCQREGLKEAFEWIEQKVIPMFERQEENRKRKGNKIGTSSG